MGKRKGRDDMAAKSANLYARIEPDVKEQAEEILATLGIPASNAINMFYKQIILNRGLPFEVKIPTARPVDISRIWTWNLRKDMRICRQGVPNLQLRFLRISEGIIMCQLPTT